MAKATTTLKVGLLTGNRGDVYQIKDKRIRDVKVMSLDKFDERAIMVVTKGSRVGAPLASSW